MNELAYPLKWPAAYPRTKNRKKPTFKRQPFSYARDRLIAELRRMGATNVILSSNVPLRNDGLPTADFERRIVRADPGCAVYFKLKGTPRVLACDRWDQIEHNLHGLELTIEAMRGLERWGASEILERAFTGFTALPAPEQWWEAFGFNEPPTLDVAEKAYRIQIQLAHPDRGGSEGKASKLNWAIGRAREELRR